MWTPPSHFAASLLELLESAPSREAYRQVVLREVHDLLGADASIAMPVPRDGSFSTAAFNSALRDTVAIDAPPDYLARKAAGWDVYFDEIGPEVAVIAKGHVALDTEVFGPQARARMALYGEVMRPVGVTSKLIGITRVRGRLDTVLILLRCGAERFRTAACERLEQLMPIIALADSAAAARFQPAATAAATHARRGEGGERIIRFREGYGRLSPREREVVGMISRGLQNKEIASALGTAPSTVRKQTIQAFRRLGTTGRVETAVLAIEALTGDEASGLDA